MWQFDHTHIQSGDKIVLIIEGDTGNVPTSYPTSIVFHNTGWYINRNPKIFILYHINMIKSVEIIMDKSYETYVEVSTVLFIFLYHCIDIYL